MKRLFGVYRDEYARVDSWVSYSPRHKTLKIVWPWFGRKSGIDIMWCTKWPKVYRLAGWKEFTIPKHQTHAIQNGPPRDPVTGFPIGMPVNWQDKPVNEREKP